MSKLTKQAIKDAFLRLIEEYPLKQISVRVIAEECGINRNSFYYHFTDIPALIEEIVRDAADMLIRKYPSISSLEEAAEAAFRFMLENKRAVLHICNSVNRDIYERYLMHICEYMITTMYNTIFGDKNISGEDKEAIITFVKCELFGMCIEWINTGMPESAIIKLKHIISIFGGLVRDLTEKCSDNNK